MNISSELITEILGLLIFLVVLQTIITYILKHFAPKKYTETIVAFVSSLLVSFYSVVCAGIVGFLLYLLTFITNGIHFSWIFVGIIFLIALIVWIIIDVHNEE